MSYYDEDERYFEPSLADDIVLEFKEKMKDVLLDSVKQDISAIKAKNEALIKENEELKSNRDRVNALERSVQYEKKNLLRTVRSERLSELMKDFSVVMYTADNEGKKAPKCNKCDENRNLIFTSPKGKKMKESCDCDKTLSYYIPKEYYCSEFRINRNNEKLLMWYKENRERDEDDYYQYQSSNFAETLYNSEMKYDDLTAYNTYFVSKKECQKYCDWLNNKQP